MGRGSSAFPRFAPHLINRTHPFPDVDVENIESYSAKVFVKSEDMSALAVLSQRRLTI